MFSDKYPLVLSRSAALIKKFRTQPRTVMCQSQRPQQIRPSNLYLALAIVLTVATICELAVSLEQVGVENQVITESSKFRQLIAIN